MTDVVPADLRRVPALMNLPPPLDPLRCEEPCMSTTPPARLSSVPPALPARVAEIEEGGAFDSDRAGVDEHGPWPDVCLNVGSVMVMCPRW